ncbi:hypothetical protein ACWDUG_32725, partial [Streptomyces cellulosae]
DGRLLGAAVVVVREVDGLLVDVTDHLHRQRRRQGKGIGGLAEFEIPSSVTCYSAVVDRDNVDQYMPTGFR